MRSLLKYFAVLSGIVPAIASAQQPMRALAFADTASVRFEVRASGITSGDVTASIAGAKDGTVLWTGSLGTLTDSAGTGKLVKRVTGLHPQRWSPETPNLYVATIRAGSSEQRVRFGFRTIRAENGRIVLNGRPVFLRGNAINPPGRNLPDSLDRSPKFAADYIRFMKAQHVNWMRLTEPSQLWFDAADELGMMIFQGHYGTPKGASSTSAPKDPRATLQWYRDSVLGPQINHPSVVVYTLANEQAAPEIGYLSRGNREVAAFLQMAHDSLHAWDDTRLYIGNAGYGFGRAGEICDLHRYWGWYYNSFLSFYTLRDPKVCWRTDAVQPMTLTENTGNYTGPDGRFNLASDTKQPDSQLNWTGHAPDAEQARRALGYQAWMAGQAIEIVRRMRAENPYLSGLAPYTIAFSNWNAITGFEQMGPKPVTAQYARSYQPVLLSWESWTPNVYAGATITPVAHVVNDDDAGRAMRGLVLRWSLADSAGTVRVRGTQAMGDVPYYATTARAITVDLPSALAAGTYVLRGELAQGSDVVSRNETPLFVATRASTGSAGTLARRVRVFDAAAGRTALALRTLGIPATRVDGAALASLDPARDLLVVGADAWTSGITAGVRTFVTRGGRALVLEQTPGAFDTSWLPAGVRIQTAALDHSLVFPGGRPFAQGMAINPERPGHAVFDGLTRDRFFLWSDHTGWNETKPGFPAVYPVTRGMAITKPEELGRVAVLADYDHGLQGIALAEAFVERGSALLSGFDLVPRVGRDPIADRFLVNLVRYMGDATRHEPAVLVTDKVTWGDYASERGLVPEIHSGLLLNTVPRVPADLASKFPTTVNDEGFWVAGSAGGWNTRPAIQYVGRGRRPFGPYEFTTGGSVQVVKGAEGAGRGAVWLRVPAGRTALVTTVENPATQPLELEIGVNGATSRCTVGAGATARCESPLNGATEIALSFRGDRRLVLVETVVR